MKLVGVIRPTNTDEVSVDYVPGHYDETLDQLRAAVPDGWELLSVRRKD